MIPRILFCNEDIKGNTQCCNFESREFSVRLETLANKTIVVDSIGRNSTLEFLLFRDIGESENYRKTCEECKMMAVKFLNEKKLEDQYKKVNDDAYQVDRKRS